mmetsp:Transcript_57654/g.95320  ORF Transcript_57654/g.95320 Transcript_57654/m.95320 type:complete len:208 (+) Transcript_57654:1067-1690(+)
MPLHPNLYCLSSDSQTHYALRCVRLRMSTEIAIKTLSKVPPMFLVHISALHLEMLLMSTSVTGYRVSFSRRSGYAGVPWSTSPDGRSLGALVSDYAVPMGVPVQPGIVPPPEMQLVPMMYVPQRAMHVGAPMPMPSKMLIPMPPVAGAYPAPISSYPAPLVTPMPQNEVPMQPAVSRFPDGNMMFTPRYGTPIPHSLPLNASPSGPV